MRLMPTILFLAVQAQAATLYVSTTGSHDTNAPAFSTLATAATNIQAAIDAASAGDTVIIAPGTYPANGSTNYYSGILVSKQNLTIQGGFHGTLFDADRTIINGSGRATCFIFSPSGYVASTNASGSVIRGLTLLGARGSAVAPWSYSNRVENCIIRGINGGDGWGSVVDATRGTNFVLANSIVVGVTSAPATSLFLGPVNIQSCIIESSVGQLGATSVKAQNCIVGGSNTFTSLGGNITNILSTQSLVRALGIAPASDGAGTNLQWSGVSAYMPRIGSIAQGAGVGYAGIDAANSGDGGPRLIPVGRSAELVVYGTNTILAERYVSGTYAVPNGVTNLDLFIVGGGGGAGGSAAAAYGAGGGGAGGVVSTSIPVSFGMEFDLCVGSAGMGGRSNAQVNGNSGAHSYFGGYFAYGGGGGAGGGSVAGAGVSGGSGGGGSRTAGAGGVATNSQGFAGGSGSDAGGAYSGGGGGGATSAGSNGSGTGPAKGGGGITNALLGSSVVFAVGGNGGIYGPYFVGTNAVVFGGGGNGGGASASSGGQGGAGFGGAVIIRDNFGVVSAFTNSPNAQPFSLSTTYQVGDALVASGFVYRVSEILPPPTTGPFNIRNPTLSQTFMEAF